MNYITKLSRAFEHKVLENQHAVDPSVVVEEHEGVEPVSYMAFSNLKTIINDATELLSILNDEDDLPQWVDEMLAISKNNVSKALDYVRSEKIETESLLEDHKEEELVAEAQERGYFSRLKNFFNKPEGSLEVKIHELDTSLRGLYKGHGPGEKSLDERINLAKRYIEDTRFVAAKNELNYFNETIKTMVNLCLPFIEKSLPNSTAGFFDMFKSKKEVPLLREPRLDLKVSFKMREELSELLDSAEYFKKFLKNIFFPSLDRALSDNDTRAYLSMLKQFLMEQKMFQEKFEYINRKTSILNSEILSDNIQEMKESLRPSPEPASKCPCGSYLPWSLCHGIDKDKIKNIMNENNVSYDEAVDMYRAEKMKGNTRNTKLQELLNARFTEPVDADLSQKVAQINRFKILLKNLNG